MLLLNNTSYVKKIMIDVTNEFEFSLKKKLYYHFNFRRDFQVCDVKINILRDRFLFCTEEVVISEVILGNCSEFYQIGTPHFSLEGVVSCLKAKLLMHKLLIEQ